MNSNITKIASFLALTIIAAACSQQSPSQPSPVVGSALSASALGLGSGGFTTQFSATALCAPDIGRILFSGTIEGVDQTTVDAQGRTHRTRQFRVKGLSGVNLDYGTTYTVIGGAEMLTWNSQIGQVPGVGARSMHAGTLVFEPSDGGANVVAHHTIHYVENGQGQLVLQFSAWRCVTSGG